MSFALQGTSLIDYPGRLACVVFLAGCNLRCPYCHNARLVSPTSSDDFIGRQEVSDFLARRRGVLEAVVFSGGEPCLRPALGELITEARDLGYLVKLDTNGLFPDCLEALLRDGQWPDYLAMDLKCPPELYPSRIPGSPADAAERLAASLAVIRRAFGGKSDAYEFRCTMAPGICEVGDCLRLMGTVDSGERLYLQRFRSGNCLDSRYNSIAPLPEGLEKSLVPELASRGIRAACR